MVSHGINNCLRMRQPATRFPGLQFSVTTIRATVLGPTLKCENSLIRSKIGTGPQKNYLLWWLFSFDLNLHYENGLRNQCQTEGCICHPGVPCLKSLQRLHLVENMAARPNRIWWKLEWTRMKTWYRTATFSNCSEFTVMDSAFKMKETARHKCSRKESHW